MPAPLGSDPTITFLSGVTSDATVAPISYGTWTKLNQNPPSYDPVLSSWTFKWGSATLLPEGTPGGNVTYWFKPLPDQPGNVNPPWDATSIAQWGSALALWSAVANITFTEVPDAASAKFFLVQSNKSPDTFANANQPYSIIDDSVVSQPGAGALITVGTDTAPLNGVFEVPSFNGGDSYYALVHELGHLIGLGHGGPYNATDIKIDPQAPQAPQLQFSPYDMQLWSMMSYVTPYETNAVYFNEYPVKGTNWGLTPGGDQRYPTTPMMLDILAAQRLYGVPTSGPLVDDRPDTFGFNANLGNDSIAKSIVRYFDFTVNQNPIITIWDLGLKNTLDLSGWTASARIDLNPGSFSSANGMINNIAIAGDTFIDTGIGGGGNDVIIGNSHANFLLGNAKDDFLFGNDGFDTMTGGPGFDRIDGGADGGKSVYSGSHLDYQLTQFSNGSPFWTVADLRPGAPDGTDDLSNVQFLQFTDTNIDLRAARNFDGLNRSDFAWQGKDGTPAIWLMDGTNVTFDGAVGPFASGALAGWQIKSTGDFNADGRSDFAWQGQDGTPAIWLMDGTNVKFAGAVGPFASGALAGWQIKATGDFNDDVKSDILWQGQDGTPAIWLMDGTNVTFAGAVGPFASGALAGWQIKSTGDFNGDTKADILWQGQDGTPAIWLMDGTNVTFAGAVGPFASGALAGWQIKGSGDFNGDGKSDIVWQGQDGTPAIWLMDGTTVTGAGAVGSNPGASWHVVGAGQFNDGVKAGILWQDDGGQAAVWLMDGMNVIGNTAVGENPGADWHLIA